MAMQPTNGTSDLWLLGAGFSRALSSHLESGQMPLTDELAASLQQLAEDGQFTTETREYIEVLPQSLGNDAEAWLTYLLGDSPYLSSSQRLRNRAAGLELASAVAQVVRHAQAVVESSDEESWASRLGLHWNKNQSVVVTLNYDTLAERLLMRHRDPLAENWSPRSLYHYPMRRLSARAGGDMFGGEQPAPARVLKLHGSINWFQEEVEVASAAAATYVGSFSASEEEDRNAVGVRPLILPPTYTKAHFYEIAPVREQWIEALQQLQYVQRLVIVGSSLRAADWDLRNLLVTGVLGPAVGPERYSGIREKEVLLVDTDEHRASELRALLQNHAVKSYTCIEALLDEIK